MSLVAQFIQGVDITEVAISESLYAYAANLLKQELEILVAIDEYEAGRIKEGRAPNVKNILSDFYDRYEEFNKIAHPTRAEIVERLSTFSDGERYGPTTIPQFNADLFQILYGNQVMLLVMLLGRMRKLFCKVFELDLDEEETRLATSALRILIDEGVVEVSPKR